MEDLLSIVIITYNRAPKLERTLHTLMTSRLNSVPITVLNNASPDNTLQVCSMYEGRPNFRVVTHKFNIGGGANIMRAYEYAETPYVWIMSDDDEYDFSELDDLEEAMRTGKYNIIHIGCTNYENFQQYAGRSGHIKDLVKDGYRYFRLASNVVCSIVKVDALTPYIRKGYDNVVNYYPHMPFLLAQYEQDTKIYITKHKILSIYLGATDNYNYGEFLSWWIDTSKWLKSRQDQRDFILSQFITDSPHGAMAGIFLKSLKSGQPSFRGAMHMYRTMTPKVKLLSLLTIPARFIKVNREKVKGLKKVKGKG